MIKRGIKNDHIVAAYIVTYNQMSQHYLENEFDANSYKFTRKVH